MDVQSSNIELLLDYMAKLFGGDDLNWDWYSTRNIEHNPEVPIVSKIVKRLFMMVEELGFSKKVDDTSNGHEVKKLLRCAASSCFDKDNICCKACDIKNCRYKCNFLEKEVCEHEFI